MRPSGTGVIPYRRYGLVLLLLMAEPASPQGQIRLKSGADSKVWIEEGVFGLFMVF